MTPHETYITNVLRSNLPDAMLQSQLLREVNHFLATHPKSDGGPLRAIGERLLGEILLRMRTSGTVEYCEDGWRLVKVAKVVDDRPKQCELF